MSPPHSAIFFKKAIFSLSLVNQKTSKFLYIQYWLNSQIHQQSNCKNINFGTYLQDLDKIRSKITELQEKGIETLTSNECRDLIEKLIKIQCKLPHQNLICKVGFEKSLACNDWKKAVQFFSTGYLNDSILNNSEEINQWNFVTISTPVCINNEIYLFPNWQSNY